MRSILLLIFLVFSLISNAATYYIATNGSDSNPGTINAPFATWQKGFTVAQPGDIVYVRGGTYYPKGVAGDGKYNGVYINSKNGSSGKMINVWAYPGEEPILDCKNMTQASSHMGVYLKECSYWYLKGLKIKNCIQTPGYGAHGLYLRSGNYNRFEQIEISFIGGSGLAVLYAAEKNYIYNCDVHDCFDQYTKNEDGTPNAGEHADGIDLADITERPGNERVNTLRGVRCWNNADDGFDHYRVDGVLIIDSCWVWHNGYNYGGNTPTGDGNGFKLGKSEGKPENYSQRTVTNCIAYDNRQRGFSQENANVNMILYNNIAYKNKLQGFAFVAHNRPDILRNNISYRNSANGSFQSKQTHDHNSWDNGVTVTDEDFVSLDATQLGAPRKANGCLPDITFLALAPGSDLIDKGVDVGKPYSGKSPDMGPFEVKGTSTTTVKDSLLYVNSVIENAAPSIINILYSSALAEILPAASGFSVNVNSVARTVTSLSISGTKILLNLANPVAFGDKVTISYKKPASNFLQSTGGSFAPDLTEKPVTNSIENQPVPVLTGPTYLSAVVQSPTMVQITYNLQLSQIVPSPASFLVTVDSVPVSVNSVSVSGSSVFLTLENPVGFGDEVILDYTVPQASPIQGIGEGQAAGLDDIAVVNILQAVVPEFFGAVIENGTPNILEITYTADLANTVPQKSAFIARINGKSQPVSEVLISGNKVSLILQNDVQQGDAVTIAYVSPALNPLQAAAGGNVLTFSDKTVINHINGTDMIRIYPNPATEFISIPSLEPAAELSLIRVFDTAGKLCFESEVYNTDRIPINLKSGMYIVQIVMGSIVKYAQKLVVR